MILGITGHRKLGGDYSKTNAAYLYVKNELEKKLKSFRPEKVITGMALGADTLAAEICIELGIPFIAAIPFIGQENYWKPEDIILYNVLLLKAEKEVVVCEGGYAVWKLMQRNKWIVDNSDEMIAVYKQGEKGGTKNCIDYANSVNKPIHMISVI